MRRILIAVLGLGLAGCGLTDTTQPAPETFAIYILQTVNGAPLPFTYSNGAVVTSDVLTLFADGTYSDAAQLSTGGVSVEQGYYTPFNGSISFTEIISGTHYLGTVNGTTFTEVLDGLTKVYNQHL